MCFCIKDGIFIDPPYNTGSDFVYRDNFKMDKDDYEKQIELFDDEGDRLFRNTESNGRFHSDWCSMIYPRLVLARNLLRDDGVIFISIDDNEVENLKKITSEVFGESNFIAQLIWERAYAPKNDAKFISNSHDYVLMFAKNIFSFTIGRLPRTDVANARYTNPDNDPRGVWKPSDMSVKTYNSACDYPITTPSGRIIETPASRCWSLSKNAFLERLQDNRIWFGADGNSVPCIKRFLTELKYDGMAPQSIMFYKDVGHSQEGAKKVVSLFDGKGSFDGPKPVRLLRRLLTLANVDKDDIVLDFFSGSATTAHAVMQLNAEDCGKRKFIMVQLPEVCAPDSEATKASYTNICEIGKERMRRAGDQIAKKIEEENTQLEVGKEPKTVPDIGFRVLKLDDTNMKDVYYAAGDYTQDLLESMTSNIKDDRTDMDLLYSCLLDWGLPLSLPHTQEDVSGVTVHTYNDGDLIACFADTISDAVVKEIAKRQPLRAVFRDSSFSSSPEKINVEEIFKLLAPNTSIKVL
ncbi:site-specific DNA-methyltransferase [Clostridia bacterium]|nr:site-specific DNA-methyltransferase [Clostridia bacterium]